MMEHVSLSFNKRWHLKVCACYGNDNVRMKAIPYKIHGNVLRVFEVCASGITRKFQEHVNHNVGIVYMSNASKRHVSQGTVSKLMYEVYAYPIRLCMHEKMF
jgi:hypothetical protein